MKKFIILICVVFILTSCGSDRNISNTEISSVFETTTNIILTESTSLRTMTSIENSIEETTITVSESKINLDKFSDLTKLIYDHITFNQLYNIDNFEDERIFYLSKIDMNNDNIYEYYLLPELFEMSIISLEQNAIIDNERSSDKSIGIYRDLDNNIIFECWTGGTTNSWRIYISYDGKKIRRTELFFDSRTNERSITTYDENNKYKSSNHTDFPEIEYYGNTVSCTKEEYDEFYKKQIENLTKILFSDFDGISFTGKDLKNLQQFDTMICDFVK